MVESVPEWVFQGLWQGVITATAGVFVAWKAFDWNKRRNDKAVATVLVSELAMLSGLVRASIDRADTGDTKSCFELIHKASERRESIHSLRANAGGLDYTVVSKIALIELQIQNLVLAVSVATKYDPITGDVTSRAEEGEFQPPPESLRKYLDKIYAEIGELTDELADIYDIDRKI